MGAFEASSSVVIGDVDCTVETDIASEYGVSGYPTIKYFTPETDPKGDDYSGGRDLVSLKKFVEDKLERKCDVASPEGCSEKEAFLFQRLHILGQLSKDGGAKDEL